MPLGNLTNRPPANPHAVDDSGVVKLNVPCRICGYSLRALHEESRCPECGSPVTLSLDRSLLRFADPQWVRALWMGATLNLAGMCMPLALILLAGLASLGLPLAGVGVILGPMLLLSGVGLLFGGSWLLNGEEPMPFGRWEIANAQRRRTRGAIGTSAVASVAMVLIAFGGSASAESILFSSLAFLVAIIAAMVWHVRMISPLASAIRRVPDLALAEGAERMHIYVLVFCALLIATTVFGVLGIGLALLLFPLALLAGIIAWLAWLIFLFQVMTRFKREYRAALRVREPE